MTDIGVNDKGKCVWSGPATFKVNCRMQIHDWPFDEQKCELAFGSFTYGKNLLRIKLFKDKSDFASKESYSVLHIDRENWILVWLYIFMLLSKTCHMIYTSYGYGST